jgi:hypothetical protein
MPSYAAQDAFHSAVLAIVLAVHIQLDDFFSVWRQLNLHPSQLSSFPRRPAISPSPAQGSRIDRVFPLAAG